MIYYCGPCARACQELQGQSLVYKNNNYNWIYFKFAQFFFGRNSNLTIVKREFQSEEVAISELVVNHT